MPTGYTSAIADGISFEDFVLQCARAFGALVTMRNEPMDAEIPLGFKIDQFYPKLLRQTRKELKRIEGLTDLQVSKESKKEYENELGACKKSIQKDLELLAKYNQMLTKVRGWQLPTLDHVGLKDFMIEQIETSIYHDCDTEYTLKRIDELKLPKPQEWVAGKRAKLLKDVDYYTRKVKEEKARVAERSAWVKTLRKSFRREEATDEAHE